MPNRHRRQASETVLHDEYDNYVRQLPTAEAEQLFAQGAVEARLVKRAGREDLVQVGWKLRDKHQAAKHESAPSLTVRDVYFNAGIPVHLRRGVPTRHSEEQADGKQCRAVRERVETWNLLTQEVRAELTRTVRA